MLAPHSVSRRRAVVADALGLLSLAAALGDYLRPSLLLLDSFPAGGDLVSHYPTAVFLRDYLLPLFRLHGWYPGAYLGQPVLLYYFPLPFLVMAGLSTLVPMSVAFKLGTALGVFLFPACSYLAFRLLGFRFPGPLLAAAGGYLFLLVEENPIWGGPIASTLAGEFSYTYGMGLGIVFLGLAYRSYARGESPALPAVALGLTALAHGYAVLWAGCSAGYFLYGSRRPLRTLLWLGALAFFAAGLVGLWLLPLLWDWGFTTPFNDAWITVSAKNLLPQVLLPLFACALLGLLLALGLRRLWGGADRRLLYLWHAALVASGLGLAGPALGIIDVRFVPFAQLSVALAGCASLGLALQRLRAADAAALGLTLLAVAWADSRSHVVRYWAEYDFAGLQAKELWPAWSELNRLLRGSPAAPRVAVEYSPEHERAGSIRMYETLPFFSGRSTLEGAYNQASLNTHAVYYLASQLGERSPNPFRNVEFSSFDPDAAMERLRLFGTDTIVALSAKLKAALAERKDVLAVGAVGPYSAFRVLAPVRYVEPLACAPLRTSDDRWRDKAQRWFARKPLPCAMLVFTADTSVAAALPDEWLPPPEQRLDDHVSVRESVETERIEIETSRIGHPLLVKVSWHPRWRAEGASGPYRVAPALMLVVPRQHRVTLRYGPNRVDTAGRLLSVFSGLSLLGLGFVWPRLPRATPSAELPLRIRLFLFAESAPTRRWGGVIPAGLLLLLLGARLIPDAGAAARRAEALELRQLAESAFAQHRHLDAAEYARHALSRMAPGSIWDRLALLRGESLLEGGRVAEAGKAFESLLRGERAPEVLERARQGQAAAEARAARGAVTPGVP